MVANLHFFTNLNSASFKIIGFLASHQPSLLSTERMFNLVKLTYSALQNALK